MLKPNHQSAKLSVSEDIANDHPHLPAEINQLRTEIQQLKEQIANYEKSQSELQYRLSLEELLATLSTHFINLPTAEIDGGIQTALEWIGSMCNVERAYVFLIDETNSYWSLAHHWHHPHIPETAFTNQQNIAYAEWQEVFPQTIKRQVIYLPDVEALQPSEKEQLFHLLHSAIKSLILIPMVSQGELIGCLGFDMISQTKSWSEEVISLFKIMAEMFVNTISRKRFEQILSNNERKYRHLVETCQDLIWSVDQDGRFTYVNQATENIYGCPPEEIIGKTWQDLAYSQTNLNSDLETAYIIQCLVECPKGCEIVQQKRDGTPVYLSFNSLILRDAHGNFQGSTGTATDITERKQSEEALRQAKHQLQAVLDAVPWLVSWISHDLRYVGVNRQLASSFKLVPEDFIGKEIGFLNTGPGFVQFVQDFFNSSEEQISQEVETKVDGQVKNYLIVFKKYDQGQAVVCVGIDISDRKQAEIIQSQLIASLQESERKYRTLYEATGDAVILLDHAGIFLDCNRASLEMFGCHSKVEFCTQQFTDFSPALQPNNHHSLLLFQSAIEQALTTGNTRFEWIYQRLDNTLFPAEVLLTAMEIGDFSSPHPLRNKENKLLKAVVRDITERKRNEEKIKASLEEKEVLLKEIHHRVKNNLQVISSLLRLQSRYITDPQILEMLQESQNRVQSMALVHEQLYQSADLSRIDFADYIHSLTSHLYQAYEGNAKRAKLLINVTPVLLNIDTAVPCGLIINELVSNSLKYAFPGNNMGNIQIDFQNSLDNSQELCLTVQDNGIGFPQGLDFRSSGTLGLRLVCSLVRQLSGNIELENDPGTIFIIKFPHPNLR
ncbi:MAG: PAS domain S-box protein [Microcoleaceae cyanobacterium]